MARYGQHRAACLLVGLIIHLTGCSGSSSPSPSPSPAESGDPASVVMAINDDHAVANPLTLHSQQELLPFLSSGIPELAKAELLRDYSRITLPEAEQWLDRPVDQNIDGHILRFHGDDRKQSAGFTIRETESDAVLADWFMDTPFVEQIIDARQVATNAGPRLIILSLSTRWAGAAGTLVSPKSLPPNPNGGRDLHITWVDLSDILSPKTLEVIELPGTLLKRVWHDDTIYLVASHYAWTNGILDLNGGLNENWEQLFADWSNITADFGKKFILTDPVCLSDQSYVTTLYQLVAIDAVNPERFNSTCIHAALAGIELNDDETLVLRSVQPGLAHYFSLNMQLDYIASKRTVGIQ